MPARSSVSSPSPIFGNSIIVIPIEWPVTWPSVKPRSRKPFATARWTSCAVAPSRSAAARGVEVLLVGLHHLLRLVARLAGADRARDLDPVAARPGDLERRQHHVGRPEPRAPATLNSGSAEPFSPDEHHVHRLAAAALRDEVLLARREHLALGAARRERLEEDPEALDVDAHALAHRVELEVALDGARVVERDVPRDELGRRVERR